MNISKDTCVFFMKVFLMTVIIFLGFGTDNCFAQRTVISQNQIWMGYMTTLQLNKRYSLWNDVHLVPKGFFLLRTGVVRDMKHVNITAGYAYGRLPASSDNTNLTRTEHRPWAQAQTSLALPKQFVLIPRLRYDARFRQDVLNGAPIDAYSFIHRVRLMVTLRKFLTTNETSIGKPFINLSEELLLNFGKNVTFNRFDQNRISLMIGTQHKTIQLQVGYMNRFVKTGTEQFTRNHTLVFWLTHRFGAKQAPMKKEIEVDGE
jgi:Protein of unknown function (DUF2490)